MTKYRELDANDFAAWLEKQPEEILWTVSGGPMAVYRLYDKLEDLPATGKRIADAIRQVKGKMRAYAWDQSDADVEQRLEDFLEEKVLKKEDDNGRVMLVSWVKDGEEGEPWLIMRDMLTEEILKEAHEAGKLSSQK